MTRRILLITQWFDPEPTPKGMVFARELVRCGFEVEVLTGFPNYPGGRVYPGYRVRLLQRESIDGVKVTRVALYPSHDHSGFKRALNYLSFGFAAAWYVLFCARRPDVVYAYHPPMTVGIVAALARRLRRIPSVLDIQDLWPDALRATGMLSNEYALALTARVCRFVYRSMDVLVALSPGFKSALVERGVPATRVEVIYNWCDEAALSGAGDRPPVAFPGPDRFRVVFAGNMGKAQALDAVFEAVALLRERVPELSLIMVGGGVEVRRLKQLAAQRGMENVVFIAQVPMSEVGALLRNADALLVHLRNDPLFGITIPSKTQAYMAAGRPLIMGVAGDAARLVADSGCGLIAKPEDPASIAEAIATLAHSDPRRLAAMAEAGVSYYRANLSLRVGVGRFVGIFDRLMSRKDA
jgi:glycosyltransferase involved in cell wall biosynthesis